MASKLSSRCERHQISTAPTQQVRRLHRIFLGALIPQRLRESHNKVPQPIRTLESAKEQPVVTKASKPRSGGFGAAYASSNSSLLNRSKMYPLRPTRLFLLARLPDLLGVSALPIRPNFRLNHELSARGWQGGNFALDAGEAEEDGWIAESVLPEPQVEVAPGIFEEGLDATTSLELIEAFTRKIIGGIPLGSRLEPVNQLRWLLSLSHTASHDLVMSGALPPGTGPYVVAGQQMPGAIQPDHVVQTQQMSGAGQAQNAAQGAAAEADAASGGSSELTITPDRFAAIEGATAEGATAEGATVEGAAAAAAEGAAAEPISLSQVAAVDVNAVFAAPYTENPGFFQPVEAVAPGNGWWTVGNVQESVAQGAEAVAQHVFMGDLEIMPVAWDEVNNFNHIGEILSQYGAPLTGMEGSPFDAALEAQIIADAADSGWSGFVTSVSELASSVGEAVSSISLAGVATPLAAAFMIGLGTWAATWTKKMVKKINEGWTISLDEFGSALKNALLEEFQVDLDKPLPDGFPINDHLSKMTNELYHIYAAIGEYEKQKLTEMGAPVVYVELHDHSEGVAAMREWASSSENGQQWCEDTKSMLIHGLESQGVHVDTSTMDKPLRYSCPPPGAP